MSTESNEFNNANSFLAADINVEESGFGSQFPLVQWVNGDPKNKPLGGIAYTGGFFISADAGIDCPPGFEEYTLHTQDAKEVKGFAARDLKGVSVIRYRKCWSSDPGNNGLVMRFGWNDYEEAEAYGSARGVAHILIGLKGFDEPLLVSFRGMTAKGMMGMGRNDRGVIPTVGQTLLSAAKREARKSKMTKTYPLCAFSFDLGPKRNEQGEPVFEEVGSGSNTSLITLPTWLDATDGMVSDTELQRRYVGNELLATYQDVHREAEEWVRAWDSETLSERAGRGKGMSIAAPATDVPGEHKAPF